MSSIFNEVTLSWGGRDYTIKPTMDLVNRIENKHSLARLAYRMGQGDTPLSHVAGVLGILLRSAGAKVDDGEIYTELMTGDSESIQAMCSTVLVAVFPKTASGNDEAPAKKPAVKKAKKSKT